MDSFALKVLTPAGVALSESVTSVTLPGSDGEVGILPGHCRYVGLLGTGSLKYVPAGQGSPKSIVVSEGSCQFEGNALTVLADEVRG